MFICQPNSGRSQIAEAYLKKFFGDAVEVESGGLSPAEALNLLVDEAMAEAGIDLSAKKPQNVFELFKAGKLCDHVVTVCHDSENRCPLFPGITNRWHWPFPDPAKVTGTAAQLLDEVRRIRDMIAAWIQHPSDGSIDFNSLLDK